jgi:DNA-directed RNA polymerase specialized sigma24 family protein
MADAPTTSPSLLVRIRDPRDADAWGRFVDAYAPVVYGFARRRGLQDADAADLTQDVPAPSRDRRTAGLRSAQGSFRGWLFTVVRNRLRDQRDARCPAVGTARSGSGTWKRTRAAADDGAHQLVRSVAFAPDGKRAVSGSRDETICLWT